MENYLYFIGSRSDYEFYNKYRELIILETNKKIDKSYILAFNNEKFIETRVPLSGDLEKDIPDNFSAYFWIDSSFLFFFKLEVFKKECNECNAKKITKILSAHQSLSYKKYENIESYYYINLFDNLSEKDCVLDNNQVFVFSYPSELTFFKCLNNKIEKISLKEIKNTNSKDGFFLSLDSAKQAFNDLIMKTNLDLTKLSLSKIKLNLS